MLTKLKHIFFVLSAILFHIGALLGLGLAVFDVPTSNLYLDILWLLLASCCAFGGLNMAGSWLQNRGNINVERNPK